MSIRAQLKRNEQGSLFVELPAEALDLADFKEGDLVEVLAEPGFLLLRAKRHDRTPQESGRQRH